MNLIVSIVIFAILACGIYYVCRYFELPKPVLWVSGVILLLVLLYYTARVFGGGGGVPTFLPLRR
jgi:hypothetical protein